MQQNCFQRLFFVRFIKIHSKLSFFKHSKCTESIIQDISEVNINITILQSTYFETKWWRNSYIYQYCQCIFMKEQFISIENLKYVMYEIIFQTVANLLKLLHHQFFELRVSCKVFYSFITIKRSNITNQL